MIVSLKPKIIFEDDSLLVIDKPAGMVVNRVKTAEEKTIQDWVEEYLALTYQGIGDRAGIVHRLDKETSGLLLIAKTKQAFKNLQQQFKARKVAKTYLALVHGQVKPKKGIIEMPVSRSPFNRQKFGVFLGGKPAKTKYQVKKYYQDFTFLELFPQTGRTHQIRVHLKHLGHPIVGDEKYGGRKKAKADRQWCPRQFLHATGLSLRHPKNGQKKEFSSPLPEDLQQVLTRLD